MTLARVPVVAAIVLTLFVSLPQRVAGVVRGRASVVSCQPEALFAVPDSTPCPVRGQVQEDGRAIPYAHVSVKGSNQLLMTDKEGRFTLTPLPPGRYVLLVTAMGYETLEWEFESCTSSTDLLEINLSPAALELNPLVVTGTMRETFVSESPVKVEVINVRYLERNTTHNLMEAIQTVNGLYTQVDCGVCYTSNIRINGMEGPYTAVLIDGMPIMSALASVYGLNGINPSMIERMEVIKGPSSTLYGSEAMAGVVNVITKDPEFTPRYSADLRAQSSGERILDASFSRGTRAVNGLVSASVQRMNRFLDANGDGFSDLPKANTTTFMGKLSWRQDEEEVVGLAAKYYHEDRWGGVAEWTPELRGSDQIYGESILTNRVELMGSLKPRSLANWKLDFSYAWHDQDAMYGATPYTGTFQTYFGNLIREGRVGSRHTYLVGLTARHHVHDDNTVATVDRYSRFIPGAFLQDEYVFSAWSMLGGMRLDHHENHGVIASPRLSVKWSPTKSGRTTLRMNGGTGFRVVNAFSEDFAAIVHGSRDVVIGEKLDPERSWSVTGNLNQILGSDGNRMALDVDLFYTRFSNQLIADYDVDPQLIVFRNLDGKSVSRGASVTVDQGFSRVPLLYSAGITLQDVYSEEAGHRKALNFSPVFKGVWSLSWELPRGASLDYTGTVVGPMKLPEFEPPFERDDHSPTYSIHNLQGRLDLGRGWELYASVKNLFDWTQVSPLIDPEHPFGDAFDTSYVYGPIFGRQFLLGIRVAGMR